MPSCLIFHVLFQLVIFIAFAWYHQKQSSVKLAYYFTYQIMSHRKSNYYSVVFYNWFSQCFSSVLRFKKLHATQIHVNIRNIRFCTSVAPPRPSPVYFVSLNDDACIVIFNRQNVLQLCNFLLRQSKGSQQISTASMQDVSFTCLLYYDQRFCKERIVFRVDLYW